MKRLLFAGLLLTSAFACVRASEPERAVQPAAVAVTPAPILELDDVPVPAPSAATVNEAPNALADLIPTGTFTDITAFCRAQEKLAAPRIAAANKAWAEEGNGALKATPSCIERPELLADAKMGPFVEVKAVVVEMGSGTAAFLLVAGKEGWTTIRTPFLEAFYDDPGCGSIEREGAILELNEDAGALVVVTESGRSFYKDEDDNGELTLRSVRTCRPGASCNAPTVVGAKATLRREEDAPVATRTFTTSYRVESTGAIVPATVFDEATL